MAAGDPLKVTPKNITSTDIVSMNGGLDERGDYNSTPNTFVEAINMMVDARGVATKRFGLQRWLPDTVEPAHQVYAAVYGSHLYFVTADDGKIKYCEDGATSWIDAGGTNSFTTGTTVKTIFVRVLDKLLIVNGVDKLAYLDLTTMNITKYTAIANPTAALTVTPTVLTLTGSNRIYYAISYNSTVGTTKAGPIFSSNVSKARENWKADGTEYLTITPNAGNIPAGAKSWNLYVASAAAGGSIAYTDLLPLAQGLDLAQTSFIDNGSLSINLSAGTAPEDNSTAGMICKYGLEVEGRPILYGDVANPYNIWIGGDGDNATDFSATNGGYRTEINKGSNYFPTNVIGFRNGQGIPSLTVLFSSPTGIGKQSILEQQTVTYGNLSFVVWGNTEQNYGSAGVAAAYGAVNYLGALYFPSTDGFLKYDTQASLQNVLTSTRISDPVQKTVASIKNSALNDIVGTAWDNRVIWSVAMNGYATNNTVMIYDLTNKDMAIWYKWDIAAQWLGVISPNDSSSFVYICQGNHIYRLVKRYVASDDAPGGLTQPFPTAMRGAFNGLNQAHNEYKAVVQVVFDFVDAIGQVTVGFTYANRGKKVRTKTKTIDFGEYLQSGSDGWDSPSILYDKGLTTYLEWDDSYPLSENGTNTKQRRRVKMRMNVITNEMQWFVQTDALNYGSFTLRAVSYEGVTLGNKVDLR